MKYTKIKKKNTTYQETKQSTKPDSEMTQIMVL